MEPNYTRLLNASTVSDDADLYAGLYAELKKAPQDGWRWSVRTGRSTPQRWSTRPDCAYKIISSRKMARPQAVLRRRGFLGRVCEQVQLIL